MILGNYRVLKPLGIGGMGIIYQAEHLRLPRMVAIKVLKMTSEADSDLVQRFANEIWCIARLNHPNIVSAIDAGEEVDPTAESPNLPYFVMEYIPGQNLHELVKKQGPLPPDKACDLIHQLASALVATETHHLIHRDIKPSNILVTPEGVAKLFDFGLARLCHSRMTMPNAALGTIDYLAPEQARDASTVDIRADIYGLGGTLFWCLTGQNPFPSTGNTLQDLMARLRQVPPSVRERRPDMPAELDKVIRQMLAVDPGERLPTPQSVMQALLPFLPAKSQELPRWPLSTHDCQPQPAASSETEPGDVCAQHVLVVDDEPTLRRMTMLTLQSEGLQCDQAANGMEALSAIAAKRYDLVLSDIDMPEMTGLELLQKLRQTPPYPHLKFIMFSGRASLNELAQLMSAGADDYLSKPLSILQLRARVQAVLRLKQAQARTDQLNRNLMEANRRLQQSIADRPREQEQLPGGCAQTLTEHPLIGASA